MLIQKILVALRNIIPVSVAFPVKPSEYEAALGVISELPKNYKIVKNTVKSLAESLWASANLLSNGNVAFVAPPSKTTDPSDLEETLLKQISGLLKDAYEAQQKQRKEYEGVKSELDAKKEQVKKIQEDYDRATKELSRSQSEAKGGSALKEQIADLKEKLATSLEELNRKAETLQAMRKEKLDMQDQCARWEEKCEVLAMEGNCYKDKYTEALKEAQDAKNEYELLKLELGRLKEKNRVIEEYQDKVEQLDKQLRSKIEEIESNKKAIENLTGMLEVEEAKREWLLKTKENELLQLQDSIDKNKSRLAGLEEEVKKKGELEKILADTENKLKESKSEGERKAVEKEEMKKYAESLLGKLKKKETDSIFLVLLI